MSRREIFDAIRTARGKGYSDAEVALVDRLLDQLGVGAHALRKPDAFFHAVRAVTTALDETQVRVINALLGKASAWPIGWLAYALATAWHEARLRPIREIGEGRGKKYGLPGKHGGQVAYGRGLPQITWDYNYEAMDAALGLHGALIANYDLALDPEISARLLIVGMERGKFTGKSLATYLGTGPGSFAQFEQCRRIINGTDRAGLIAGYAMKFQSALEAGEWS